MQLPDGAATRAHACAAKGEEPPGPPLDAETGMRDNRPFTCGLEGKMRQFVLAVTVAAVAALAIAVPGSARGLTAEQLEAAGWTCFPVPGLGVHCAAPGQAWPPTAPVVQLLYFDDTGTEFHGTETLVRDDVFQRRGAKVCPTEPGGWFLLPFGYWGCHRN
jgi:hypothetical protein